MRQFLLFLFIIIFSSVAGQNSPKIFPGELPICYHINSSRTDSMILDSDTLFLEVDSFFCYSQSPGIRFFEFGFFLSYKTTFFRDKVYDDAIQDSVTIRGDVTSGYYGHWWIMHDSILVLEPWDWKIEFCFYLFNEGDKKYLATVPQPWFGISSFEMRDKWHPPLAISEPQ
jgi:hypothetical protein